MITDVGEAEKRVGVGPIGYYTDVSAHSATMLLILLKNHFSINFTIDELKLLTVELSRHKPLFTRECQRTSERFLFTGAQGGRYTPGSQCGLGF